MIVNLEREKSILWASFASVRGSWKSLLITDLFFKGLAFSLLSPLLSIVVRWLVLLSGNSVLSDVDIAVFLAGPVGWLCIILGGSIWLGIIALEQAALLAILAGQAVGKPVTTLNAVLFSLRRMVLVIRVAGRMIAVVMLLLAPFLVLSLVLYRKLLTDYDINFYLNERPISFQIALALGALIIVASVALLLRFLAGWLLALPLLLFGGMPPRTALQASRQRVHGNRLRVVAWLSVLVVASVLMNLLVTALVGTVGGWIIPSSVGSLTVLAGRIGFLIALLTCLGIITNFLSTLGFSLLLFHGYRNLDSSAQLAILQTDLSASQRVWNWQLTRARLLAIGIIGVLVSALASVVAIETLQREDDVLVMAHRGASKVAPENSLAAIRAAIESRADWVEIDVQETADDQVVVFHDSDFMRLAGNPLKIWNATLNDLQTIDIGSGFDKKFSEERVPTLSEVLTLCHNKIGVVIELKYYGHDRQLEDRVAQIVEQCDMANQVMIMSLKPAGVRKMKEIRPSWTCGLLMSVSLGDIRQLTEDFVAVNSRTATHAFVDRVHRAGKRIYVWTVNDAGAMSMLMNRGVDGVLTDRPELARKVLAERAELNSSERLLAEIAMMFGAKASN